MELGNIVDALEVQKCWMLHEHKTRGKAVGVGALKAIDQGEYGTALFTYRGDYPRQIFTHLKTWKRALLDLNDVEGLRYPDCELTSLSNDSLKLKDAVENIIQDPDLSNPKKNPKSFWHIKDIFDRLKILANDTSPVIVGEDYVRGNKTIIFDGFHRLAATLIYYKKTEKFKLKEAYYGSK